MRPVRALLIYLSAVFIGGALLAPWLWWLAQLGGPAFPRLAQAPFHRFVDRSLLMIALAGLWPLLRALGATSGRELGLISPVGQWRRLGLGLLIGFGSLATVAGLALLLHERTFNHSLASGKIIGTLAGAAGTAGLVATLEEILFRGGAFGGLRRVIGWPSALLASSAIYALVHFLQKTELVGPVHWNSGLVLLGPMLAGFGDLHQLVPGFFNLTLAGILLGWAYQRTGNLYFSMGLHAGWIFWLKSYGAFTETNAAAPSWFWGTAKLIDGWLAFGVLAAVLIGFKLWPGNAPRHPSQQL